MLTLGERILGGILGLIVGDALGVPVQFWSREEVRRAPVTGMDRQAGHMPPGTWSDDSSLALSTATSLAERGYDPTDMMERFRRWFMDGEMTPHGRAWDIGGTTGESIRRFIAGSALEESGGNGEWDNGNGSLMRILPLALWAADRDDDDVIAKASEVSALTHGHPRARLACAYYSLVAKRVLHGEGLRPAMRAASTVIRPHVPPEEELDFEPIFSGEILERDEKGINASGYVIDTLGASLWCCAREGDYRSTVLAAVNLGDDADTTGAVAGGLAGVMHGIGAVPQEWVEGLERKDLVLEMAERFLQSSVDRLSRS
jgi:ADP-ribosylglycohydrolase